ncbi:hypothetical protein EST38_g8212 [Candolleomyces aberdarensis]|uniref:Uncharacterized protein n=1 Tax=Candolleomyces aberdarensis TaxID=2316362 RepID=A0A4Q2DFZ0_9AGAR|nr:hypothetical protein EST38_g8212 [Candolleomyces aberdarensis]
MSIWCHLIDHVKRPLGVPFKVPREGVNSVEDLKKQVKQMEAGFLGSVDADCLKVWRVTEELLLHEVDAPGTDKAAKRIREIDFSSLEEIRSLSNGQDMASLGLARYETLLVERPDPDCPPSAGYPITDSPETLPEDAMALALFRALWQNPKGLKSITRTETFEDIPGHDSDFRYHARFMDLSTILGSSEPFRRGEPFAARFFIRQEFDEALDFMKGRPHEHMLLIGQSDIGKTIALTYFLVMRLVKGLPTTFAPTRTVRYLFQDSGVTAWGSIPAIPDCLYPHYRVLGDLNCHQSTSDLQPTYFGPLSLSSSPLEDDYRDFQEEQSFDVKHFVMKPLDWLEVYSWSRFNGSDAACDFSTFQKYGGLAINLVSGVKTCEVLDADIDKVILAMNLKDFLWSPQLNWDPILTHHIIEMRPVFNVTRDNIKYRLWHPDDYTVNILSPYVYDRMLELKKSGLVEALRNAIEDSFESYERPFLEFVFQDMVHKYMVHHPTPEPVLRPFESAGGNYRLTLGLRGRQLMTTEYVSGRGETVDLSADCYYKLPTGVIDPLGDGGINSFAFEVDSENRIKTVVLFRFILYKYQYNRASIRTDLGLTKELRRHLGEQLDPNQFATEVKWKLVFVVPRGANGRVVNLEVEGGGEKRGEVEMERYVFEIDYLEALGYL